MKRFLAGVLLTCMPLTIIGCGQAEPSNQTELNNTNTSSIVQENGDYEFEDEIVVGRVVPYTGRLHTFGDGTPYVEESAIQAINDRGGVIIDGKRCSLKLMTMDSHSTVSGAEEAAKILIDAGIDVMIVSNTADTVLPVSAVCEREDIACISTDAPASAWAMGGPYTNSWHAFFDNEREMLCFLDAWESIDSNKKIGLMTANDNEGIEISTFIHDFAATEGYTIVDTGAYYVGETDYSEYIETFAEAECDIILGVMVNDDFKTFWTQLQETDYRPKMCTIAKACLFESDIMRLGDSGDGLITEVWWNSSFPYASSITGQNCSELSGEYLMNCQQELQEAPQTLGYKHANIEILYDILKRAGTMNINTINKCAAETELDTIVGHVAFGSDHISPMSCVTGQWVMDEKGNYKQEIVGNYLIPSVETTADIKLLE